MFELGTSTIGPTKPAAQHAPPTIRIHASPGRLSSRTVIAASSSSNEQHGQRRIDDDHEPVLEWRFVPVYALAGPTILGPHLALHERPGNVKQDDEANGEKHAHASSMQ